MWRNLFSYVVAYSCYNTNIHRCFKYARMESWPNILHCVYIANSIGILVHNERFFRLELIETRSIRVSLRLEVDDKQEQFNAFKTASWVIVE